jgi:hypothetical protein
MFRGVFFLILALMSTISWAKPAIDYQCEFCTTAHLDSLNIKISPVRVNQVGYKANDYHKRAFVADPHASANGVFQILNLQTGIIDHTGTLSPLGNFPELDGKIQINAYWNSITRLGPPFVGNTGDGKENLFEAKFGTFTKDGRYKMIVGPDTSKQFEIRDDVYNDVIETVLHFFGVQRSGDTDSWFHPPSHLLDGSALGAGREGSLAGGWYDCGDHFKVSQTTAYTLTNLMLTYTLWPEKSEDRYGSSYNDTLPYGNDGIPDVLREAKVGADFVYKLYKESKKDGLIASNDMYQQVGVHANDHAFWDRPEKQDAQPFSKGGPDRVVHAGTGVDVGAQYVAGLALFAKSWEPFDPDYAAELKAAAIDMYDNVVLANLGGGQLSAVYGFYPAQGRWDDDFAMGTIGMWYLTGDQKYGDLLYKDKSVGPHGTNAKFNMETFPGGALASQKELFSAGGWVYDYQNTHLHALWAAYKFFFATDAKAATWNVPAAEAKEMRDRIRANILTRMVNESSNGSDTYNSNTHLETHYPYNLLFTGNAWGFNRYNFGAVLTVAAAYDVLRVEDPVKAKDYYEVLMDNLNYTLGINPWELSFVIGAGTKYSNHPHHRGASPEGYNAGGIPYEYKKPIGAFMGGAEPGVNYLEDFNAYTSTETCSDYASQLLLATQLMAQDLPPDFEGPKRTNVVIDPVDQTTAYVNWEVNEMSQDTVHISKDAGGSIIQSVPVSEISKRHSVLIENLDASTTYYFTISGIDIFNNSSVEDNHGAWFSFTTAAKPLPPANPSDVRICNVTDESATLYWWTSEYASTSGVAYGTDPSNVTQTVTGDDKNSLTRFHQVTIKGLQPNTTYYADVISGGTKNDNNGSHYSFTTTVRFVDMSIYVKPKWDGSLLKYYFYVSNNDVKPFTGLELRYYYEAPDAATYSPKSWSTQYYDETGLVVGGTSTPTIGAAVNVPGTSYYYVPITLTDEISVSGAARIELEMKKNGWDDIHIDEFKDDWSVQAKDIPIEFKGIDFGNAGNFDSPDFVETIDSINIVTYAKTPYISAHYQGVHIYGYPPNYTSNTPNSHRDVNLFFESPLISPATSVEIDSFNIDFRGSAWATPDGNLDLVQLDGQKISQSAINSRVDSVSFSKSISGLKLGAKYYDFVAWHNSDQANCACEHQRITVDIDTVLVPVETRYIHTSPIDTLTGYINRRIPVTFYLSDEPNGTPIDEKINLVLAAKNPGIEFYATSSSDSPITEITLLNGQVTVYIMGTSINKNELIVRGKGGPEGFLYVPAENPIQILELPPYPIIDRAIILDDDCNGTPDHMTIQINQKYAAGQSLSGVSFTLQGDSVFVPAAQIKVTNDTVLTFSLEGDYKVDGAPAGDAILINKVDGKTVEFPLPYEDGIGPTAISSAVYENLNPGVDPD